MLLRLCETFVYSTVFLNELKQNAYAKKMLEPSSTIWARLLTLVHDLVTIIRAISSRLNLIFSGSKD